MNVHHLPVLKGTTPRTRDSASVRYHPTAARRLHPTALHLLRHHLTPTPPLPPIPAAATGSPLTPHSYIYTNHHLSTSSPITGLRESHEREFVQEYISRRSELGEGESTAGAGVDTGAPSEDYHNFPRTSS